MLFFLKHWRREGVQSFTLRLSYHFDYKNLYLMYFELRFIFYSLPNLLTTFGWFWVIVITEDLMYDCLMILLTGSYCKLTVAAGLFK